MRYSNVVLLGLSVVALTFLLSPSIVSSAPQTRRNLADSDCVHGKMVNSTCECDNGWYGKTCASDVTCPNDCSGHGSCSYDTTPPSCDCEDNWIYGDCSQHVWNPLMFLVDSKNVTNVDVPTCGWQYFRFSKVDAFATTVYNLGNNTAQVYLTKEQIFQGFDPKEAAIGSCTADSKKSCVITVLCGLSDECVSNVNTTFYLAVQAPEESTFVNAYLEPIDTSVPATNHHNVSSTWFGTTNTKEELEFFSFEVVGTEDVAFYGVEVTFQNTSAPVTVWGRVNNTADQAACSNGTQTCTVLPDVKGHPGSCKMEFLNCKNQINATYYFTYSSPVGGANLKTNFSVIEYPYSVMDLTDGVEFVAGSLVGGLSDFYQVVISHDQIDAATSIRFVVNTVAEGDSEGISNDGSVTLQLSPDGYPYTGCLDAWMDCDNVEYCSLVVPPCMLNFTTLYATVTSNDVAPAVTAYKISTEVYGAPDATSVSLSDHSAIVTDSVSDNVYNHYSIDTSGMTNLLDVTVYINSFQEEKLTEKITMYINRDKPAGTGCFEEEFKCDTETSCALQIEPCYLGGTIYVSILGDAQVDNVPVEYTLSFQEVVPQKLTTNQRVSGSVRSKSYTEYIVDVPDNLNYGSRVTVQIESQGGGAVLYWQEDALAGGPCCLQNRDSCTAPCSLELGVGCQLSTSNTLYLGVQAASEKVSSFDITLSTVEEPAWSSLAFGEVLSTRMTQTNAGEPFHHMYDVSVPGNMTDKCSPGNFIVKGKILKNMVDQKDKIYLGVYRKDSDWKSAKTTPTCVNTVVDTVPIENGEAILLIDPQQDLSDLLVFIGTQDGSSPDVGQFLDYEIQVTALSGEATALTSGRAVVDHVITDQYVHYTIDALKPTPASLTVQVYIDAASPDDSQVSLYLSNTGVAGVRGDCYDNYVKCEGKKTCTLQVGYECLSDVELWNLAVTGTTSSTAVPVKYTLTATYRDAEPIPASEWQFFSTIEGVYQHYLLDTTPFKDSATTALNLAVSTRTTGRNLAVYLQKDSPAGPFCCLSYLMSCKVTSSEQCSLDISPQEFVAGNWYISVIDTDDDDNYAPVPFALLATPYHIAETDVVLTSSKNTFNTESHIVEADGLAKSFKIHVNETAPHGSQVVVHMHQDVSQHPGSVIHTTPIPLDVWVNTDETQSQSSALTTCDEAAECTLSIDCFDLNSHDWVVTVRGKPVPNFFYVFSLNITYLTPATLKQGTSQQHVIAQTTRSSVLDLSQQVKDPMTNPLRITINAEAGEGDLTLSSANSVAGVPSALGGYCYAQQDSCQGKNCSITLNPCQVAQNDYQSLWIGASAFPNTTSVNFNTVVEKQAVQTLTKAATYGVQPLSVLHILTNVPTHNSLYLAATNVEGSFTMSASQSGWPYKGCLDPDASTNCNGAACQLELQVCCTAKNMVFVTVENTGTKEAKFTLTPTLAPLTSLTSGKVTDGTVAVDQSRLFTFTSSPAADQHAWAPPIWVTLSGSTEGAAKLDVSSTYCSEQPIGTCNVAKGDKCTVTLYPNDVVEPAYVARVSNGASKSQDFKVEVTVGSPSIPAIGQSATVSKTIFQQYVKTYTNGPQLATTAVKLNITGGSTSATLYINKGKPADPNNNLGKISVSNDTKEGTFSLDSCDVEAADYYFALEADDDKGTYQISFTSSTPQPLKAKESLTLDGNKGSQLVYLNTAHNSFVNVHLANSTATLNSTITMYWQPVSYSENGVEVYPADSCSAGSCKIGDGKDNNDCYLFFGPEYMSNTILLRIDWAGTTPETISPVKLTYEDPEGLTQNLESGVHVDGKVDLPDFHTVYQMLPSAQLTEYENDYNYLAVDMYFECGDLTAYLWNADMGREDLVCADSKCSAIVPPCAYHNSTYYFVVAPKTETFEKVSTKFVLNATLYGVNTTLATTGISFNATTPDPVLGGQFFTLDLSGYSSEGTNVDVSTVALDGKSGEDYNVYVSPYGVAGPGCDNMVTFNNKLQSGSVAACQMHTLPSRVASVFVQNANVTVNAFEPNALVLTNGTTRGSGVSDNFHSAVFAVAIEEVGPLNVLEVTTTGVDGQTTSLQTSVQDTGADTEGCNPLTKPIETCTLANCTFKTISNCDLKVGTYLIPVVNTGNQVAQVNATAITSVHHTPLATNSFRCVDASSNEDHHHYSVSGSSFDIIIQVTDGSKASMYFRQAGVASDGCADVTCSDASDCTAQYGDSTDTTVYFTVVAEGAYNIFVSPTEVSFVDLPVNTTIGGIVHSQPTTQSVYAADFDLAFYNIVIPSVNTTWPCLTVEATATSGNNVEAGILLWPSNNLTKINNDPVCDFDPSATYVAVVRQTSSKEPNTTFAITVTMTDTHVINITGEGKASNMANPTVFVYDVAATHDASEQYRTVNFIATHDGCGVDLSVTRSIGGDVVGTCTATDSSTCTVALNPDTIQEGSYYLTAGSKGIVCRDGSYSITVEDSSFNVTHALQVNAENDVVLVDNEVSTFSVSSLPSGATFLDLEFFLADSVLGSLPYSVPILYNVSSTSGAVNGVVQCSVSISSVQSVWPEDTKCAPPVEMCAINATSIYYVSVAVDPDFVWPSGVSKVNVTVIPRADAPLTLGSSVDVSTRKFQHFFIGNENSASKTGLKISISNSTSVSMIRRTADMCSPTTTEEEAFSGAIVLPKCTSDGVCEVNIASAVSPATPESYIVVTRNSLVLLNNATANEEATTAFEAVNSCRSPSSLEFCDIGYNVWGSSDSDTVRDTAAQVNYRALIDAFSTAGADECASKNLAEECITAVKEFACFSSFRSCNGNGFVQGVCYDVCDKMYNACGELDQSQLPEDLQGGCQMDNTDCLGSSGSSDDKTVLTALLATGGGVVAVGVLVAVLAKKGVIFGGSGAAASSEPLLGGGGQAASGGGGGSNIAFFGNSG